MQKEKKKFEELFNEYQQGPVTEEEKALIARWLTQLDVMERLTPEQLGARQELSQADLKKHFFPGENNSAKIIRVPLWLRTMAASLFIASAVAGILFFKEKSHHAATDQVTFKQMLTGSGQMKTITLSDGTRITLNNESGLKYPAAFNGQTREVFLTGEAFFEVAHNPAKPFKVHTDKLDIQVLGTSFDVKAYKEDKELQVSVASGKVGVLPADGKTKTYMLMPGDRLAYERSTAKLSQSNVEPVNISVWQKGKFIFRNETLENIARQLERYYSVKFLFKDQSLQARRINLKIKNHSISTVLKALSISGEFQYKVEADQITVWQAVDHDAAK